MAKTCKACKRFNACWNETMKDNKSEVQATFDDSCEEFEAGKQTAKKETFPKVDSTTYLQEGTVVVRKDDYDKILITGHGRTNTHFIYLTNYHGRKDKPFRANPYFFLGASIVGKEKTTKQKIIESSSDITKARKGDICVVVSGRNEKKYDILLFDHMTKINAKCKSPFNGNEWTVPPSLIKKVISSKDFKISDLKII